VLQVIPNNIISCSLDNYAPCFNMFEQVVRYASDTFGDQFNALSDYNVVRYKATPYRVSSADVRRLDSADQVIRFETTYRTLWLEDQFKKSVNHEHRARSMLAKYGSWMTGQQLTKAEAIKTAAYNNAWIYSEYATLCRDNPYGNACADNWQDYSANCSATEVPCLENYELADLNIPAEDVTQYYQCETARESAANFGLEVNDVTLGLRNLGWAPVFVDAKDPQMGLLAWLPCKKALPTYGSVFSQ
jgi:hypothetical protein